MPQPPRQLSQIGLLSIECVEDSNRWWGDRMEVRSWDAIKHHTIALAGEVGEFANLVKKIDRGSLKLADAPTRMDMAEELTDVLIYVLNIAGVMDVDLYELYKMKRSKNHQRFGVERRLRDERAAKAKQNGHS